MHTSAYYLLQNSNFLNCIRRFVRSNERMFEFNQVHLGPSMHVSVVYVGAYTVCVCTCVCSFINMCVRLLLWYVRTCNLF